MKQKKSCLSVVIPGLLIGVVFCVNANAYIMANYSESIFATFGSREAVTEIRANIIDSADYFLKAYADFLVLLSGIERAELGDIDYNELAILVHSCISNLENAQHVYSDLIGKAKITPYNENVIKKLTKFNFAAYREKNSLNPAIFKEVAAYMKKGDIRGLYNHLFADVTDILARFEEIKTEINSNRFPKISGLWKLNSLFSKTLIFGQYTAMIFHKIMTNR